MSEPETSAETPVVAHGFAPCEKAARYIQQLVKHWGHKYETTYTDGTGTFPFSDVESAVMVAQPNGIAITLATELRERNVHMRGVIERHIDRFAFREVPLDYQWKDAEEA